MSKMSKGLLLKRGGGSGAHRLNFQFNPTTISERHGVRYHFSDAQGQYMPLAQFGQKEPIEISFELFFYNNAGVGEDLKSLRRLVSPPTLNDITFYDQAAPNRYTLSLDGIGVFDGVIEDLSIRIDKYKKLDMEPQSITAQIRFKVTSSGVASDVDFYKRTTGQQ